MARMKFPGSQKSRSPEKEKSLDMSVRTRKDTLIKKQKRSVIKPVLISLRRYREIFGDSDEEVIRCLCLPCTFQCFVYQTLSVLSVISDFRLKVWISVYSRKKNFMDFEQRS